MGLYPLPMRFPVPIHGSENAKARRPLEVGDYIDITVRPDGWEFITPSDRATFEDMPVADRLEYRKAFAGQVTLAKETPQ